MTTVRQRCTGIGLLSLVISGVRLGVLFVALGGGISSCGGSNKAAARTTQNTGGTSQTKNAGVAGNLGGSSQGQGTGGATDLPTDASGFTTLTPSSDTRTIYVSSSTGNDAKDGLAPDTAVKTVERGKSLLRDGYPDWLLFNRGDVWQGDDNLGQWTISGRSPSERMVIGAYGAGDRPRFEFSGTALETLGSGNSPASMNNLVFVSLHLLGAAHDVSKGTPSGDNPACVYWLYGAQDVLFEDIRFEYCQVTLQNSDGHPIERVRFFRSLFLDSFSLDDSHAQGIYLEGVSNVSLEENIFDRCGWHPDVAAAVPTEFNHCVYWQEGAPANGILRGNIIMQGSSHGAQMRSSGTVQNNLFVRNAIAGFSSGTFSPVPSGTQGTVTGNVFSEAQDITPRQGHTGTDYRGWGWDLINGIQNAVMTNNIFSICNSTQQADSCESGPSSNSGSQISGNIVWKWPNSEPAYFLSNNAGPFVEPDRTVATYSASLGGTGTFEAFETEVRKQSKTNWRPAYTAAPIITYFNAGFRSP